MNQREHREPCPAAARFFRVRSREAMESVPFFQKLRTDVLELRSSLREGPLLSAWYTGMRLPGNDSLISIERQDDQTQRLNELMTQALLGAEIPILPGTDPVETWLPLLVDYAIVNTSPKVSKPFCGTTSDATGVAITKFPVLIEDLVGVAADYLEHLTTTALRPTAAESSPYRGRQY